MLLKVESVAAGMSLASPPGSLLGMFLLLKYLSPMATVEMSKSCRWSVSFARWILNDFE